MTNSTATVQIPLTLLLQFVAESRDRLRILRKLAQQINPLDDCADGLRAIGREVAGFRDNAAFFGLTRSRKLAIRLEKLLKAAAERTVPVSASHLVVVAEALETLSSFLEAVANGRPECADDQGFDGLMARLDAGGRGGGVDEASGLAAIVARLEQIQADVTPKIGERGMTNGEMRSLAERLEEVLADCRILIAAAPVQDGPIQRRDSAAGGAA